MKLLIGIVELYTLCAESCKVLLKLMHFLYKISPENFPGIIYIFEIRNGFVFVPNLMQT